MEGRHDSMTRMECAIRRKRVADEMPANTSPTPADAVGEMRNALGLTADELAKLADVPSAVIGGLEQGLSTATVEELEKVLRVLGLKLAVSRGNAPPAARAPTGGGSTNTLGPLPPPLVDITAVEALPGYTLRITFRNGEVRLYEMSRLLERSSGVFTSLRNRETFEQAFVANGTVCWPGEIDLDPEVLYRQSVPESLDPRPRLGVAKGAFEVPEDSACPYDEKWEAMPEGGLEARPTYSDETGEQEDAALALARIEQKELRTHVSALMASLVRQSRSDASTGPTHARLVREHQKLVLMQLSDCPSLERCLSDQRWLSHCWSEAVVALGAAGFPAENLPEDSPWDRAQLLNEASSRG